MLSRLEDTLLRCSDTNGSIRQSLLTYLDDGTSLRKLRRVSRVLHDIIDHNPERVFHTLYINAPAAVTPDLETLALVAPFCQHLVIKIMFRQPEVQVQPLAKPEKKRGSWETAKKFARRISGENQKEEGHRESGKWRWPLRESSLVSQPSADDASKEQLKASLPANTLDQPADRRISTWAHHHWKVLLPFFAHTTNFTIAINGDPAWPGRTDTEDIIVALRTAMESTNLSGLRHLRIAPVHAFGIIHLRWSGFGAFVQPTPVESLAPSGAVWQRLESLELQVKNPMTTGKLSEAQLLMFKKVLNDYLRSFAPTLKTLKFVWLAGEGPNPLLLDGESGLNNAAVGLWLQLEEVWLGNVAHVHRLMPEVKERCPEVKRLMVLRSPHRGLAMGLERMGAWVEVLLRNGESEKKKVSELYPSSSTYSRSVGGHTEFSVSRTSREVPFMLDFF